MNDVAQITIRDTLVLCVEVTVPSSISPDEVSDVVKQHGVATAGIDVSVTVVEPGGFQNGRRLMVTLLAPNVSSTDLEVIFCDCLE
jgi:hypothetical protein